MSHPYSPAPCRACYWALSGLKRPPDPTPDEIAEMDAFLGTPRPRQLLDDTRARLAREWMDEARPKLNPPLTVQSLSFWDDYGQQMEAILPHKTKKQRVFFLALMLEFYPKGPRYI